MIVTKEQYIKLHNVDTINGNICINIGRTHLATSELDALGPFCRKWREIDISIRQLSSYRGGHSEKVKLILLCRYLFISFSTILCVLQTTVNITENTTFSVNNYPDST